MLRQVLSIVLALALGYGGFQFLFVPHDQAPAATASPAVSAFVLPVTPPPAVLPPPRPDICQQVTSGYFADGRPIGGYLWQTLVAKHPECFGSGPTSSSPGASRPRH